MKNLPELINYRYADRGGWQGLIEISQSQVLRTREDKLIEIKNRYRVSLDTAARWLRELKESHE